MSNPIRDAHGVVVPHDDPTIDPATGLIRHINPDFHLVDDENTGKRRIGSMAFSATNGDPTFGLSGDIEQDLLAAGRDAGAMVPPGFGAVWIEIGKLRALALNVGADPTDENPFHGQAWGVNSNKRSKVYARVERWVVPLAGIDIR